MSMDAAADDPTMPRPGGSNPEAPERASELIGVELGVETAAEAPVVAPRTPFHMQLAHTLMTEEAIYGIILVSGMIVVSESVAVDSYRAFVTVLGTVLVFWAAHVYAGSLARFGREAGGGDVRVAVRSSLRHSSGMLIAAIAPLTFLLLGGMQVLDDDAAMWLALGVDTLILAVLGYVGVARWSRSRWTRAGSALVTAAFGAIVVLLKVFVH